MNDASFPLISANTLFHFTNSIDNLLDILRNEFRPRFCLENYNLLRRQASKDFGYEFAVPLVCFCDLPLSQTASHLSVYGDYGIGMTKTWGQWNGVTPVLYLYSESLLMQRYEEMFKIAARADESKRDRLSQALFDFVCFIKPYEGDLWRESGMLANIRFYNEREWRFVPILPDDFYRTGMNKSDFLNGEIRNAANEKLQQLSRISFEPNDVKYLIVRREDEIVSLITQVEQIKGKYSWEEVKLVTSRVMSAEQIKTDF
jgi:Putative abortive phage resistance protein AbiGi, antitoxin